MTRGGAAMHADGNRSDNPWDTYMVAPGKRAPCGASLLDHLKAAGAPDPLIKAADRMLRLLHTPAERLNRQGRRSRPSPLARTDPGVLVRTDPPAAG